MKVHQHSAEASIAGEIRETDSEPLSLCAGLAQVGHLYAEAASETDLVSLSLVLAQEHLAVILEWASCLSFLLETTMEKLSISQDYEHNQTRSVYLGRLR